MQLTSVIESKMKDFVKTMLAVIAGIVVIQLLGMIFFFIMIGSAAVSGSGTPALPKNAVLEVDMSKFVIAEQSTQLGPIDFSALSSGSGVVPTIGLWDAVSAIDKAAADPAVKYIFLRSDGASAGNATMEEFRKALASFRQSGKPVIAYSENPGTGSVYLASVADKFYMSSYHGGMSQFVGVSGQLVFVKDILDKLGVNVQLIRHGKYKSAGEMFIANAPSAANLEQNQAMVNSLWKSISGEIAKSRGIEAEKLNSLTDNLELIFPEDFLAAGVADGLVNRAELETKLCDLAVVSKPEDLHLVPFADYVKARITPSSAREKVAVIFADGEIVDAEQMNAISGDKFAAEIDKVRRDKNIHAVVLRVNSPGGSVLASEKIRTALDSLAAAKPMVASYGNYAASGGYWISSGVSRIYSDEMTLTGSIGVFSMIPDLTKVADKAGVNFVTIGSNEHSDMLSLIHTLDPAEIACMQASVEDIYDKFVNLVAAGRGMEPADVDEIAQGRVWTGADALGVGLVDEIGTLKDAVTAAARLAGYFSEDDYGVATYPAVPTILDMLLESLGAKAKASSILSGTGFESLADAVALLQDRKPSKVYAIIPYEITIK